MSDDTDEFSRTIQRIRTIEAARSERDAGRRNWFRRKEDNLKAIQAERAERRKELRAWIILIISVVAILTGNWESIRLAIQAF